MLTVELLNAQMERANETLGYNDFANARKEGDFFLFDFDDMVTSAVRLKDGKFQEWIDFHEGSIYSEDPYRIHESLEALFDQLIFELKDSGFYDR